MDKRGKANKPSDNFYMNCCLATSTKPFPLPAQFSYSYNTPYIHHMNNTAHHDERIAKMSFASVYPHYVTKVEKKGRTKDELHQVIRWLTGYDEVALQKHIEEKTTFETFFQQATLHPNAHLITGLICGYRIEDITNPLTQQVRYLDKLVDELAKGRAMEKILRTGQPTPRAAK